jgi:hypothetical protein
MDASRIHQLESSFPLRPEELDRWARALERTEPIQRHATALHLVRMAARLQRSAPRASSEALRQLLLLIAVVLHSRQLAEALFKSAGLTERIAPSAMVA